METKRNLTAKEIGILTLAAVGLGVSYYLAYRIGCQHGVDVIHDTLQISNPELYEMVDRHFKRILK